MKIIKPIPIDESFLQKRHNITYVHSIIKYKSLIGNIEDNRYCFIKGYYLYL